MSNNSNRYYRKLTLTIISAHNLVNVRKLFKNKVHARVTIGGNKDTEWRTTSDKRNGLNPSWNQMVEFDILEEGIIHHGLPIVIKLYSSRKLSDKYIGEVYTSVKEIFDHARGESAILTRPINRGGTLTFSYRFGPRTMDEKPAIWMRILKAGATMLLRERVGNLVIDFLRGPRLRWGWKGRARARPVQPTIGPWFGSVRLIKS